MSARTNKSRSDRRRLSAVSDMCSQYTDKATRECPDRSRCWLLPDRSGTRPTHQARGQIILDKVGEPIRITEVAEGETLGVPHHSEHRVQLGPVRRPRDEASSCGQTED